MIRSVAAAAHYDHMHKQARLYPANTGGDGLLHSCVHGSFQQELGLLRSMSMHACVTCDCKVLRNVLMCAAQCAYVRTCSSYHCNCVLPTCAVVSAGQPLADCLLTPVSLIGLRLFELMPWVLDCLQHCNCCWRWLPWIVPLLSSRCTAADSSWRHAVVTLGGLCIE